MFNLGIAALGGVVTLLAAYAWGFEPADDPEAAHAHAAHGDGHGDDAAGGDGDEGDQGHEGQGPTEEPAAVAAGDGSGGEEDATDE
jgi:hypothetical protein